MENFSERISSHAVHLDSETNIVSNVCLSQQSVDSCNKIFDGLHLDTLYFSQENSQQYVFSMSHFLEGDFIFSGRSVVKKFTHEETKIPVAIKFINIPMDNTPDSDSDIKKLKQEIELQKTVSNFKNVTQLYGYTIQEGKLLLCMELMDMSLKELYTLSHKNRKCFSESLLGYIGVNILDALIYLKSKNIIHRDVKPLNILINRRGQIKLCDFGTSRFLEESFATTVTGTFLYWPPELFTMSEVKYDIRNDVWALGITLAESSYGKYPIVEEISGQKNLILIQNSIQQVDPSNLINKCLFDKSDVIKEFVQLCISKVENRPKYDELKGTKFYQTFSEVSSPRNIEISIKEIEQQLNIPENLQNQTVMINNNEAQLHQNMKKSTSSLDKNMQIGDTSEDQKIEAFIPVVSGLQDVITDTGYKVPQIVVIGDQGSGKSSVLESVVKRDFLPRGIGMITRAPLILQLVNVPENDPRRKEGTNIIDGDWAVFKHKENQKYTDFDEVRKEIENRTIQIAGNAKCITSIPIKLRVYSHRVIDLSLVDLPGIIRMAVGGQPSDMVQQIEKLVYEYIRKQNSIILAVIAANADVATSEALKYAKEVDPEGNRTLAVLTKLDLMDIGTNANDMLTGKIIEVKLGIIGVKLRSQADILSHKSMEKCLMEEEMFLRRNYSLLASKNGVKFLEYKLHELSMNHIRDRLPQLKQNISSVIAEIKHELETYDSALPEDKNGLCLCILEEYKKLFAEAIEGNIETNELVGGARISIIFNSVFIQKLDAIDAKANLTEKEILTIIHNSTGAHSALLTPEIAFIKLVKRQIQNLEMPCLQCIEMVFEELYKIAETCYHKIIQKNPRYPKLCEKIFEVVSKLIRSRKEIMKKCVKDLVANELAHINTHHPDFWKQNAETNRTSGSNSILIPSTEKKVVNTLTDDDKRNLAIVEYLIPHYFAIVRTKLQDMVPKSIMRLLVNYVKDEIYNELVKEIILNKNLENLLAEGPAIQSRKKELKGMLYALEQAVMESAKLQDKPIEYTDGENESDDENEDDSQPNRMENGEAEVFHNYIQNGNFHPNMVHGQYMGNPGNQQQNFEYTNKIFENLFKNF